MSLRRFYSPPESFSDDRARVSLSREEAQHLTGVLRLGAGDEVRVFDGEGREFLCVVTDGSGRGATLEVRAAVEPLRAESPLELTLCVALLKGEKFDLVVQKATELGVARVVPVETARADVKLPRGERGDGARKRVGRWRRIAVEAAKQSGRARVPEVAEPSSLTDLLTTDFAGGTGAGGRRLIFAERGGRGLIETVGAWVGRPERVAALVGPEGGWEDTEVEQAYGAGWEVVTLGGRVMRAETAGIVVAALLQHLCGDLV
ncbi:MAG: 16S rRNA (uracil(1498)-N(3))-methyltransferase [Acidobacteria bacterium]|nr:16S rRNA (uracil(1498)-N(3))-methyltransferase [Acidobacteriota bacterium]MCA1641987.1 16S rRNA (uracil(1498)-N(3))-methyltransferase [Acidobacteriota bacterium]